MFRENKLLTINATTLLVSWLDLLAPNLEKFLLIATCVITIPKLYEALKWFKIKLKEWRQYYKDYKKAKKPKQ